MAFIAAAGNLRVVAVAGGSDGGEEDGGAEQTEAERSADFSVAMGQLEATLPDTPRIEQYERAAGKGQPWPNDAAWMPRAAVTRECGTSDVHAQ